MAGTLERVRIRPVRQHGVVQAEAAGHKAARLSVILAIDQSHELAHDIHVVPGRAKRVLSHQPAVWEADKVDIGRTRRFARRGQHCENTGVGMVEQQRSHGRVPAEVVFVRRIIAVPRHDVERALTDRRLPQSAGILDRKLACDLPVFIGRVGRQEITRVGQAVGADRATLGQGERAAIVLAHIARSGAVRQRHAELDPARDDRDLARCEVDQAELGCQMQATLLRDDQQLAIGIVEVLVHHVPASGIEVGGHAGAGAGVPARSDGDHALNKRYASRRRGPRVPSHGRGRYHDFGARGGAPQAGWRGLERAPMLHGGADAVEPAALVGHARCGERTAAQLLGIQPIRTALG